MVRAQGGDRDAFARLASTEVGRLDTLARLITRDPELAMDAVQEALIRAWRDLPMLHDPARFDAWLRRLLVRACLDELRRHRRRHSMEVELTVLHHPVVADDTNRSADREVLDRAFATLDPEKRALIVMHYYLGLPLHEAADALGIPDGTAKSRLSRARDALRAALEADNRLDIVIAEGAP